MSERQEFIMVEVKDGTMQIIPVDTIFGVGVVDDATYIYRRGGGRSELAKGKSVEYVQDLLTRGRF